MNSSPLCLTRLVRPTLCMLTASCTLAAPSASAFIYLDLGVGFPSNDPATLFDDDAAGTDFEFDLDTNTAFYGAIGIDGGLLRNELELTFRDTEGVLLRTDPPSADAGSGSFDNISLMTNIYADLPLPAGFELFAGGGIGVVMFDGDATGTGSLGTADFDDAGYGFAYQLKAGVAYELTRNLQITAGYRYWASTEIDFGDFELDDLESHAVDIGLRISF
ncbi:outer membrane protein [Algisphaera agarilytica]|uniref:Opacity protein-like surface antigen n=1 Tax=Algisphaera agarilytica TaxID=1385975 RepID=A0A7X0LLK7_9BACT|nr:outer membrane beta-barrel protein [Algisphaera agarilytica]MBB6430068.1 opacity protein-like surface antigen [Algisphaera agarilytica]